MALISIVYRRSNHRISSSGLEKQNQRRSYVSYRVVVSTRQLDTLTSLVMAAPSTGTRLVATLLTGKPKSLTRTIQVVTVFSFSLEKSRGFPYKK
ncbi:hypothetical protein AVEN_137050-1 [Araneus ventricosus]|uniref:Uncharacterized protein n=1 Tax=Araneus ventricosus TaxID=182803 RepID=A0A4Y2ICJ9_ARAVE|nr:hypothetical protein AVEN_137050-1 [Araneus ventricosus]